MILRIFLLVTYAILATSQFAFAKKTDINPIISFLLLNNHLSNSISIEQLDFTLRTTCARYSFINSGKFLGNGTNDDNIDSPYKLTLSIVDDTGNVVEDNIFQYISPITSFSNSNSSQSCFAAKYPVKSDSESIRKKIRSNINNNLLLKCYYSNFDYSQHQVYSQFIPIKLRNEWVKINPYYNEEKVMNNLLFHNNVLTDLHYTLYLENINIGKSHLHSLNRADFFMNNNFPDSKYSELNWTQTVELISSYYNKLQSENSPQAYHYRYLKTIANYYTDGNIELANDLIAYQYSNYNNSNICTYDFICAALFPEHTLTLTVNPSFSDALSGWHSEIINSSNSTGSILPIITSTNPIDYSIEITLNSNHDASHPPASKTLYQDYTISSSSELDLLFLQIKSNELKGTCEAFLGCLSSGYAGYFVCFRDGNGNDLGCGTGGAYTDSITIPIAIGKMFQVTSTDRLLIINNISPVKTRHQLSIKQIATQIQNVNSNLTSVKSIRYGVFIGEATNEQGWCLDCVASANVDEIRLVKVLE